MRHSIQNPVMRIIIFLILAFIAIVDLYPIFYMVMASMKTSAEFAMSPLSLPKSLYLDNFVALYMRFNIARLFGNTVLCVVTAMIICLLFVFPASFAFAKIRFKYRSFFFMLMIATMAIPGVTFIIPNYLFMSRLGLIDHFASVIIMWSVTSLPGTVFLLTSLMRNLPNEIIEAVKIDGGNYYHLMSSIVVPLSVPGIMTVSIFNMTGWWNDLMTPLIYLQSDNMKTVTVAVATILGLHGQDFPLLLSGLVMTAIPPIILYILLQGYIRRGLVIGAVKA